MSRKIHIDSISIENREKMMKELQIEIEGSKYAYSSQSRYIYPIKVEENGDYAYIPFSYGHVCPGGPYNRPERTDFSSIKCKFSESYKLRPKQKLVKKEAISHLNKFGSTIIACFPGFGKCFKFNTPILMFDGSIKMIQDITYGEKIMGDNSTPRNVLNICNGEEQMYDVINNIGDKYTVNESHILSLKIISHKQILPSNIVKRFDKKSLNFIYKQFNTHEQAINYKNNILDDDILDINILEYLKLPKKIKNELKGYKVPVLFEEKSVVIDPYILGLWLGDGSKKGIILKVKDIQVVEYLKKFCIKNELRLSCFVRSGKTRQYFIENLHIFENKFIPYSYKCNSRKIQLKILAGIIDVSGYRRNGYYELYQKRKILAEDIVYISRSLGFTSYFSEVRNSQIYYKITIYGSQIPVLIPTKKIVRTNNSLNTDIQVIKNNKIKKYYGFSLDGNQRFIMGDFTVTHNTATSIYIATKIKLPTLVITHRVVLVNQWKHSINKFCPNATVQVLTSKSEMKKCDFYIMNATNVSKKSHEFYKGIGMLIVDEVHCIMAEGLSKSMQMIVPRYVLGLSATPYREDGLNVLLDFYFGTRRIHRKLFRKHTVYKIQTSFIPTVETTKNGRVNWGVIIESQAVDTQRNEMIIRLIKLFNQRIFMILCKRVDQANYLVTRLKEEGEDVTSLIGKQQEYEQSSRILVGITQKTGVGFDHDRLDALILASDIQSYFIQYMGRVCRRPDVEPIIFDIVDKNPILERHYKIRQAIYMEHGGIIKSFKKMFPKFSVETS